MWQQKSSVDGAAASCCNPRLPKTGLDPPAGFFALARPGSQEATMKRTYQASKVRRARTHGFLVRMKSRGGRAVINARRAKGRKRLAV